jgi:DNA-binding IclR family transcriptional regulator
MPERARGFSGTISLAPNDVNDKEGRVGKKDMTESAKGEHQNIARAVLALEALAQAGNKGLRFADVVRVTGLSKTVVHRCLAGLTSHGLAAYDQNEGLFFLGDRLFAWTIAAGNRYELAARVAPYLQSLADETEDTIYFMVRRGDDTFCYGRAEGSFPIKTLTVNIADRRPLGIGAGPLAIMAALDDADIARLMRSQAADRVRFGLSDEKLLQMIAETRAIGYSFNDGHIIQGMRGVGVPLRNAKGEPVASLTVAAISMRLEFERREALAQTLRSRADVLADQFSSLLDNPGKIEKNSS